MENHFYRYGSLHVFGCTKNIVRYSTVPYRTVLVLTGTHNQMNEGDVN